MDQVQERETRIAVRVKSDIMDEAQEIANREYDGNVSLMTRVALRRFIAERKREFADGSNPEPEAA